MFVVIPDSIRDPEHLEITGFRLQFYRIENAGRNDGRSDFATYYDFINAYRLMMLGFAELRPTYDYCILSLQIHMVGKSIGYPYFTRFKMTGSLKSPGSLSSDARKARILAGVSVMRAQATLRLSFKAATRLLG